MALSLLDQHGYENVGDEMHNSVILVLGAGVDKTDGINMPIASQLIPEIARFSEEDGNKIEKKIRSFIPSLRFSFTKFIKEAIDEMVTMDETKTQRIISNLQLAIIRKSQISNEDEKLICLLIRLFEKIDQIRKGGYLDEETVEIIKEVFGEEFLEEIMDESIIEFKKLSFSDSFKAVMKKVLRRSIKEPESPIYSTVGSEFLDIEKLLVETFIGFYGEHLPDIRKYLYISWMMWAYLKFKEIDVFLNFNVDDIPFYSQIPDNFKVISFNYTSFLKKKFHDNPDNIIYFHGHLDLYIRMDIRDLINVEQLFEKVDDIEAFLENQIKPNIDFESKKFVIPAIIPPLKLKPVLSNKYIDIWHKASEWIRNASKIIIVGYSFAYADEHFNDILRSNQGKEVYVINPSAEQLMERLSKIYGYRRDDFTQTTIQGKSAYQCHNLKLIKAKADEINLEELV